MLRGSKSTLDVIPWLDHSIHQNTYSINNFSIVSWIPRSSRGMTMKDSRFHGNDIEGV
ncbi:hypothetical protein [Rickettsia australis]|uniref:hypothetical protein n=1 Tax=Rickettsia australis TaxID=787 RepID=UPI0002ECB575|nr:hypothetical protein [Rickettsia australis]